MPDRETVIDAFERCFCTESAGCPGCYLEGPGFGYECRVRLCMDVLELLKAQEPVPCGEKIKAGDVMLDFYECGYCKNAIRKPWKYCPFCGKAAKWDD